MWNACISHYHNKHKCKLILTHGGVFRVLTTRDITLAAVDLSKAFDTVIHHILTAKIIQIDSKTALTRILDSYLSHRTIKVNIREAHSEKAGVPQGSV